MQRQEWEVPRLSLVCVTAEVHVSYSYTWRWEYWDACAALCKVLNQGNTAEIQHNSQYVHVTHLLVLSFSDDDAHQREKGIIH